MSTSVFLRAATAAWRYPGTWVVLLAVAWFVADRASVLGQGFPGSAPKKPEAGGASGGPASGTQPGVPAAPPGGNVLPANPNGGGFPGPGGDFGTVGGFSGAGGFGSGFGGFQGAPRFPFQIDAKTPVKNLLPAPPSLSIPQSPWLVTDLKNVPEVFFQKPWEHRGPTKKDLEKAKGAEEQQKIFKEIEAHREAGFKQAAFTLAKINHLNQKGTDHFVKTLIENRPDLAGLPFVMGDDCRQSKEVSRQFIHEVNQVRPQFGGAGFSFSGSFSGSGHPGGGPPGGGLQGVPTAPPKASPDEVVQAKVAALMQIFGPDQAAQRKHLVKVLSDMQHRETTRALGKLAVFSQEKEVRDAALAALKHRPGKDYTATLLQGMRYPWPAFAKNAMDAMVTLQRDDLVPTLVEFLDEPDPRAPMVKEIDGRETPVVRELVRLNHHHNCITCHTPATSDPAFNKSGLTTDFLTAPVSIPGQSLASPSVPSFGGYGFGNSLSPDIFVRIDVTYLRQDFSLMQLVPNAEPLPPVQRFDFLVRTREVTAKHVEAYQKWVAQQSSRYVSPYQRDAVMALRRLTGRNADPSAAAWREALNQ